MKKVYHVFNRPLNGNALPRYFFLCPKKPAPVTQTR